jgi:hypothetical protein
MNWHELLQRFDIGGDMEGLDIVQCPGAEHPVFVFDGLPHLEREAGYVLALDTR